MTSWWNKNSENRIQDFVGWVGDHSQITKSFCRKYVISKQYKSIIDCGCGLGSEYFGYKHDKYEIEYTGLDSCKHFIEQNSKNSIIMVEAELEKELPLLDNSFECVFCRGVIEHLSAYEKTLSEFIRVAQKEVLIGWFIKPDDQEEKIDYWVEEDLYHNRYNKQALEKYLLSQPKVDCICWEDIDDKENVLHIILKSDT